MTVKRKLSVACLLLLSLLLMVVSAAAAAGTRDVRMHGPNGDGGGDCIAADATATEPAAVAAKPGKPPAKAPATRIKPIVPVRSGGADDNSVHAPRWHSFLPGMFR